MKVQKIIVENRDPLYLLVIDKFEIVEPVMRFIKYLDNTSKSPNTIKTYCYHLKTFYVYVEQRKITLDQIHFDELANFVGWLRNPSGHTDVINIHPQEAKREESTVNVILYAVVSFLDYLSRSGEFQKINVTKEARGRNFKGVLDHITKGKHYKKKILKLRVKKNKTKTLEYSEVKAIADACRTLRDKLIIIIMYEGGLRIGEVLSLRLEDIATWDNQINITPREENLDGAYIKQRKERVVHLSKELMALYTDYIVHEYGKELEHDYVFINLKETYYDSPLKYQSAQNLIRRLSKRTGISFTLHMLRHTHATDLIRNGWDVAYVQKRLGHAHVQTTLNTYFHLSDQDRKKEYKKYLEWREKKQ